MEKSFFISCIIALSMTLCSCSNSQDAFLEQEQNVIIQQKSATDLVRQLKAYDSRFTQRKIPMRSSPEKEKNLTWLDWLKVGVADVKGGIAGYKEGGWAGAAWGAAIASLEKYIDIYVDKNMEKCNKIESTASLIAANSDSHTFNDSIGYYHNMAEDMLYDKYGNAVSKRNIAFLLNETNNYLNGLSLGYRKTHRPTNMSRAILARRLSALKAIPDSAEVGFFDYCEKVKAVERADSSYIDFAAEYLYTCVCANVGDIREYTKDVLQQIDSSNAASRTKEILSSSVLIGFSSLMYSAQIECDEIKQ